MKCPHCQEELTGLKCPDCGADIPFESRYCMYCGSLIIHNSEEMDDPEDRFDPEDRILCPDGTCTGILIDGICSECGKKA